MDRPTRGEVEAQIAGAVVRFQREQQGRGPGEVRAYIVGDLVIVRCRDILTHTESKLAVTDEGSRLIRSARHELRTIHHEEIEATIGAITGVRVLRSYCDVDVASAEQMEVYVLEASVEDRFSGSRRAMREQPDQRV